MDGAECFLENLPRHYVSEGSPRCIYCVMVNFMFEWDAVESQISLRAAFTCVSTSVVKPFFGQIHAHPVPLPTSSQPFSFLLPHLFFFFVFISVDQCHFLMTYHGPNISRYGIGSKPRK